MLLGKIFRNQSLALPKLRRRNEDDRFCDRYGTDQKILRHIGELDHAPSISPSRDPPVFYAEIDQTQYWDDNTVKPITDDEFDQTVSW